MTQPAIAVEGLVKSYGDVHAVRGVDLEVAPGEVFALLGPNGAGKTTTVEILEGFRARTSGDVRVLGQDPEAADRSFKARLGIVLQETGVERFLTVTEVIEMYGGYYPAPLPVDEVISLVGLDEKRNERVYKLSGGQMRRLDVGVGLAGDPELLFLDEPTTGFDPSARRNAWDMIAGLKALGKTVFLTTHYMDEAQYLADRVAIIVDGRIVAEGPPGELIAGEPRLTKIAFRVTGDTPPLPERLDIGLSVEGSRGEIESIDPVGDLNVLTSWALDHDVDLEELTVTRSSLEDIYLQLTRRSDL